MIVVVFALPSPALWYRMGSVPVRKNHVFLPKLKCYRNCVIMLYKHMQCVQTLQNKFHEKSQLDEKTFLMTLSLLRLMTCNPVEIQWYLMRAKNGLEERCERAQKSIKNSVMFGK